MALKKDNPPDLRTRSDLFEDLRQHVYSLADDKIDGKKLVNMLVIIDRLQARNPEPEPAEPRPAQIRNLPKTYFKVDTRGRPFLAEFRESDSDPFLVSKDAYFDIARVVASAKSESAADLMEKLHKDFPGLPEYLLRTCIRFWRSEEPKLIRKIGVKYTPADPSTFLDKAKQAWLNLKHK